MPIPVSTIVNRLQSSLDAEGSGRYLFDQDYKPNINSSIEWMVSVFNAAFGAKKFTEEALRELVSTKVWQCNKFSRFFFDPTVVGDELWSIIGIYPLPTLHPNNSISPLSPPEKSIFKADKSYIASDYSCERLSAEEWNLNKRNPFLAGNNVLPIGMTMYAYKDFNNYDSTSYATGLPQEIEVRPSIAGQYVAMEYLKKPGTINLITDNVNFPVELTNMVFEKTLNFISYKQGDGTNLYGVTEKDIERLVAAMN